MSEVKDEKEHKDVSKDAPDTTRTEAVSQALFADTTSSSNPRSSAKTENTTNTGNDSTRTTDTTGPAQSTTSKLFEESIKAGDKGLNRPTSAPGLQDVQILGVEKMGAKTGASRDNSLTPALESGTKNSSSINDYERLSSSIIPTSTERSTAKYSNDYPAASDLEAKAAGKLSAYADGGAKSYKPDIQYSDSSNTDYKTLPYKVDKSGWDSASVSPLSKNIVEGMSKENSKLVDYAPSRANSVEGGVMSAGKILEQSNVQRNDYGYNKMEYIGKDNPVNQVAPFEKYRQLQDGAAYPDKIQYTQDWKTNADWKTNGDLKNSLIDRQQNDIYKPSIQDRIDTGKINTSDIGPGLDRRVSNPDFSGKLQDGVARPDFGKLPNEVAQGAAVGINGLQRGEQNTPGNDRAGTNNGGSVERQPMVGGPNNSNNSSEAPAHPSGGAGNQIDNTGRNSPSTGGPGDRNNSPFTGGEQRPASPQEQRTTPSQGEQRTTPSQSGDQRPATQSEQRPTQSSSEQRTTNQGEQKPSPSQEQTRPQTPAEQVRNQPAAEQIRNTPPATEQQQKNEQIRAQQDQEQKAKDEAARREAIAHATAVASTQAKPAEQNNQQAAAKQELAAGAKELARVSTEQASAMSLKALTQDGTAAGKVQAADQAKISSQDSARAAEANAKSLAEMGAKNAADAGKAASLDASKAATLDASKNVKVDATAAGAQQIAGKDVLTGKVSATDAAAAANAAAGKPGALNAADAAAVRAQLDGKNTGVNAAGIRNDAINAAAAGKPGALNPANTRGDIPGAGPRTNAPGVMGPGGKFTEIPTGKMISGRALPGDASGGKRFLTGVEIGLLLAAAGVAKSRFDAARGTKDGGGLVLNNDGRMMSIRSGKDYIVGAFGEKGSQTLFALADGAKRFPSREITLSAVLAITGATKMRDMDTQAGLRNAEQTIRIVRTVGKLPERKVEFEVPQIQGPKPQQETDGGEPEKQDKDKLDNQLIGFLPAAPALFRAKRKETEEEKKSEEVGEDADGEDQNSPIPIPRFRRSYKIDLDETLTGIAEAELGDINLAWLIADLNSSKLTEYEVDGKRVVEMRKGTKLELPLPHEVVEFYKTCANIADPDNLVTIVVNTDVDRERLEETLNDFLGLQRKAPQS